MRRFRDRLRRYAITIAWVAQFVGARFPVRVILALVLGPLGLAFVGSGVGLAVAVGSRIETGESVSIANLRLLEVTSETLLPMALIAAVIVGVGAGLVLVARHITESIAATAQPLALQRVLATRNARFPEAGAYLSDRHVEAAVHRLLFTDTRRLSLALRLGIQAPTSLALGLAGTVALVWMVPPAGSLTIAFIIIALPAYYVINVRTVRATKQVEALTPPAATATRMLRDTFARRPGAGTSSVASYVREFPVLNAVSDAWRQRYVGSVTADFTSQAVSATAFLFLLLVLGRYVVSGSATLTIAAAFIVVLQLTLSGYRALFRTLATVSRYYPALFRLQQYIASGATAPSTPLPKRLRLRLDLLSAREVGGRSVTIDTGEPLGLTLPVSATRFTAGFVASVLSRGTGKQRARLVVVPHVVPKTPPVAMSVRELYDVPNDAAALSDIPLEEMNRSRLRSLCDDDLDAPVSREAWRALDVDVRQDLALGVALLSRPHALIVNAHTGAKLASAWRDRELPLLLVRWSGRPKRDVTRGHLVVAADGSLVAYGTPAFVRQAWPAIQQRVTAKHDSIRRAARSDVAETDEDAVEDDQA